jgi:hypothetical protein
MLRRIVFTLVTLVVTIVIGQGAASADEGDRDLTPQGPVYRGPTQVFEDGSVRRDGHRMLSRDQVTGVITDLCMRRGGDRSECKRAAERRQSPEEAGIALDEGPQSRPLSMASVAPLYVPQTSGYGPNGLSLNAFLGR